MSTEKSVFVEEPITNDGAEPFAEVGLMENCAYGVVVPSPRKPFVPSKKNGETPALPKRTVDEAYKPPPEPPVTA